MGFSLQVVRSFLFIALSIFLISACGGGGGGNSDPEPTPTPANPSPSPEPDLEPEPFTFVDIDGVQLNTAYTSNAVTVSGVDSATEISIDGGEYALDGGDSFTDELGSVEAGQSVVVRLTSSGDFATAVDAVLTIGGISDTYTVTTFARDVTPEDFSFDPVVGASLSEEQTSNTVTISGINDAVAVAVSGGLAAVNGGEFSASPADVVSGDTLQVRLTSSDSFATETVATVTLGDFERSFSVTTMPMPTPTPVPDTEPDAFTFVDVGDATFDTVYQSNAITIEGIDDTATISIQGGEYALGGSDSYTSDPGTVALGQSVVVRLTSSNSFATSVDATLSVGGVTDTFTVTTVARDITPNSFTFTPVSDAALEGEETSNVITIEGINDEAPVTVSGGLVAINGGAFSDSPGSVVLNDTLQVSLIASEDFDTETSATVTIGDFDTSFTVTTLARDTTPLAFTFTDVSEVGFNSVHESNAITIEDVNDTVTVSVVGGEYRIGDSGDFVSTDGSAEEGDSIVVRGTAASTASTTTDVTLTIGGVSDTFSISTITDDEAPVATIVFPPPSSMTEAASVTVRGTTTDNLSAISSVQVNGIDVTDTSDDGSFATWTVSVDLVDGETTSVVVSVEDAVSNTDAEAATVRVKRDSTLGDFPDSNVPIPRPVSIAYDEPRNRLLIGDSFTDTIVAMDLDTGVRSELSPVDTSVPFGEPVGLYIDSDDVLWVGDNGNDAVYKVDIITGARTLVSDDATPNGDNPLSSAWSITQNVRSADEIIVGDLGAIAINKTSGARTIFSGGTVPETGVIFAPLGVIYDDVNDRYLMSDIRNGLFSVDPDDGSRTLISSNTVPSSDPPLFNDNRHLAIDRDRDRVLISNQSGADVIAVDLSTRVRTVFTSATEPDAVNALIDPRTVFFDDTFGYAFVTDDDLAGILAVDIVSGERVFVSKADI